MDERKELRNEDNKFSLTRFVQYLTKNNELTRPQEDGEERGHYKSNTSHIELNTERVRTELIRCQYMKAGAVDLFRNETPTRVRRTNATPDE
jgi:hypothetical protein